MTQYIHNMKCAINALEADVVFLKIISSNFEIHKFQEIYEGGMISKVTNLEAILRQSFQRTP